MTCEDEVDTAGQPTAKDDKKRWLSFIRRLAAETNKAGDGSSLVTWLRIEKTLCIKDTSDSTPVCI